MLNQCHPPLTGLDCVICRADSMASLLTTVWSKRNTMGWATPTVSLGYFHPHAGLARALRRRFPEADVIVHGHTHRSHVEVIDGVLVFNPGGVHQWNPATVRRRLTQKPDWFEWCWLQVARHLRSYPKPSVGILEIEGDLIRPMVIEL